MKVKELSRTLSSAILAGMFISLGASAALVSPNKTVSAFIFTLGLTAILAFKVDLFTGKCGYLLSQEKKRDYLIFLCTVWLGNLIGCWLIASGLRFYFPEAKNLFLEGYSSKIEALMSSKSITASYTSVFCGMLMHIAVDGVKRCNENRLLGCVCYILAVATFVMCGFEHCVADMFYLILAGNIGLKSLLFLIAVTVGNFIGGTLIHLLLLWADANHK